MRGAISMRRFGIAPGLAVCALVLLGLTLLPAVASARRHARRHARSTAGCVNANTPVSRASTHAMRAAVLCLVNVQRAAHGVPRLHASPLLNRSAQGWTNTMVNNGFFSHGSNFAARISAVGFIWSTAGENIATGYRTPRQVVDAWMASTGHCQNILNPSFRDAGTGVNQSPIRGYGTGTWTQDFATPQGQRAPSSNWGPSNHCPY
jgi:uncharacterized protein YkwD